MRACGLCACLWDPTQPPTSLASGSRCRCGCNLAGLAKAAPVAACSKHMVQLCIAPHSPIGLDQVENFLCRVESLAIDDNGEATTIARTSVGDITKAYTRNGRLSILASRSRTRRRRKSSIGGISPDVSPNFAPSTRRPSRPASFCLDDDDVMPGRSPLSPAIARSGKLSNDAVASVLSSEAAASVLAVTAVVAAENEDSGLEIENEHEHPFIVREES